MYSIYVRRRVSGFCSVDAPSTTTSMSTFVLDQRCFYCFAPTTTIMFFHTTPVVLILGAVLVDYSADTGVWVFDTLHWSRYAMDDSDDDDDGGNAEAKAAEGTASKLMPPPPPLGPLGRIPRAKAAAEAATRGECSGIVGEDFVCWSFFVLFVISLVCCLMSALQFHL